MKFNFLYLIFAAFLVIFAFWLYAQVDHTYKTLESQINSHNERLEVLEIPPQSGEDVEKIKLRTQLADANTKLIGADFDKMKLELKESNQQWLWGWAGFLGVMFAVIGVALWFFVKLLIEDRVEERLNGFKESVDKVSLLEGQIKILEKEHAVSILDGFPYGVTKDLSRQHEPIKSLSEDVLLEIFNDKTLNMSIRMNTIEVLAARRSSFLVSTVLDYLNSIINSDIDWGTTLITRQYPKRFLDSLRTIKSEEAYQGHIYFLNRLIKENPKNKGLFLPPTVLTLAKFGLEMQVRDWVDMLREVIPDLITLKPIYMDLIVLAKDFDQWHAPEGIREILEHIDADEYPQVKDTCLELLDKYHSTNIEGETNEPEPTN